MQISAQLQRIIFRAFSLFIKLRLNLQQYSAIQLIKVVLNLSDCLLQASNDLMLKFQYQQYWFAIYVFIGFVFSNEIKQILTYLQLYLIEEVMKKQTLYKTSLEFLEKRKAEIDGMNISSTNAVNILKQIAEKVKTGDHIGIIIAFHNGRHLERLFKYVHHQHKEKGNEEIVKDLATLYIYGYDCFFKNESQYTTYFDYFRHRISKFVDKKTYQDFGGENKRYELMRDLLLQFIQSNDRDKQLFERGKIINEFITNKLNLCEPETCFEECVFTFLRIQIEAVQSEIIKFLEKQEIGLFCCKLHFEQNGYKSSVDTKNQNFSRDLPALPNKKILKEETDPKEAIKRHVVSYLNSSSGIFYIGIDHNNIKDARFYGMPITEKDKQQILGVILSEIVMKIYPPDQENEDESENQQAARMQRFRQDKITSFSQSKEGFTQQYEINRYIFVDFINLYNSNTWFYARSNQIVKYIVRIKVKLGDPYEVYHFINEKETPEAYLREDKRQKKLSMMEYYDEVYRRLKNKMNDKAEEPPKVHALCRISNRDGKKP